MNKETLEEVAENNGTIIQFLVGSHSYEGVWFGYKHPYREGSFWWRSILNQYQQERMYSEEEVHKIIESYQNIMENNPINTHYDKCFEQFKKK